MKKILVAFCLLFMIVIYNNNSVNASSKFKIEEEDGRKVLVKYSGNDEKVIVPNGVTVIEGAFKNNSKIKTIILPNTVKVIEEDSFSELKNLKKVKFSSNL
ncbi:leucine-rich repeat protein [uncultured Eubacterium sp.]|uniref:leucine-rich repeat protein n=1 Tax=uncultured Eubacterium sp. TaxID=165185 RepID=UPI002593D876|nr:leucine-rich repeat protein [uncultured Eubacterium sp.]